MHPFSQAFTYGTLTILAGSTVLAASPPYSNHKGILAKAVAPPGSDATKTQDITVTAKRLSSARGTIQSRLGATTYTLSGLAIAGQPGGEEISLNQTLLQTPGVSQDSFGQIHLRNDHANIQYRIDGVILPEGISFFGQSLTSRFASSVDLITGTLPAQYGLVTTGVVDIQTESGAFANAGSIGLYGGSHGWLEPSSDYAGHRGSTNFYFAGDYIQNQIGIESPTGSINPSHDKTKQGHAFGYVEQIIDSTSKISVIAGGYQGDFEIPANPGQQAVYADGTIRNFDSAQLNENQTESNDYAAVSYLKAEGNYGVQISAFGRYSTLTYRPDQVGDLEFYGLAQLANRADIAEGLQADGSDRPSDRHTIRFGLLFNAEQASSRTNSMVFPCLTADCSTVGTIPEKIADRADQNGYTYSIYLQDEWHIQPEVTINYGLRYDVLNAYTDAEQVSPRLSLVWKPDSATAFHLGYSRYFTPPSLELISVQSIAKFAGTTAYPAGYTASSPPANDRILPERAHYFDVGAEHVFFPGLKLGADGYWKIARDLIDEGQFGAPIILSVFNYARANVLGMELSGSYSRGNFSAYGNFAIGRERAKQVVSQQFNFSSDDLAYIANHYIYTDHSQSLTASAGSSYRFRGTTISADLIYGSGLREDAGDIPNGGTVTPYLQLNLGATHRFNRMPGGPIELQAALINLADRIYQIRAGSGVGVFAPQYGPRRALYGGIRKFF